MFSCNEVEHEIKALKTKYQAEVEVLEKVEPIFSTLRRLRAQILEKKVPGFRGFMIDFIECNVNFYATLDLALKNKLFSVIVDDLEAAKYILELNSQIKGGVINIFPLSQVEHMQVKHKDFPIQDDIQPLLNFV